MILDTFLYQFVSSYAYYCMLPDTEIYAVMIRYADTLNCRSPIEAALHAEAA